MRHQFRKVRCLDASLLKVVGRKQLQTKEGRFKVYQWKGRKPGDLCLYMRNVETQQSYFGSQTLWLCIFWIIGRRSRRLIPLDPRLTPAWNTDGLRPRGIKCVWIKSSQLTFDSLDSKKTKHPSHFFCRAGAFLQSFCICSTFYLQHNLTLSVYCGA